MSNGTQLQSGAPYRRLSLAVWSCRALRGTLGTESDRDCLSAFSDGSCGDLCEHVQNQLGKRRGSEIRNRSEPSRTVVNYYVQDVQDTKVGEPEPIELKQEKVRKALNYIQLYPIISSLSNTYESSPKYPQGRQGSQ